MIRTLLSMKKVGHVNDWCIGLFVSDFKSASLLLVVIFIFQVIIHVRDGNEGGPIFMKGNNKL